MVPIRLAGEDRTRGMLGHAHASSPKTWASPSSTASPSASSSEARGPNRSTGVRGGYQETAKAESHGSWFGMSNPDHRME